ncbi:2-C-methyl-D-erythritol 4-phosphate cytidylyltransferase [Exilibacterium tricleocarpae]|uniref:2-C-methyl-D-erythritol 4-phosphate cytidylyltransferase n=1 Tax=Exilibacterium tricleocarpae TaxID=2591008 RepID=A0A545U560_9GAMM|nr:2-C-methyl-D-erythritol 4-phosphate cytidylyltransferase [Exilibacterium tricleocarpae]TQV84606.1 2-C-methyl-D-erythritol 4-phosphate cytidylyltransferase [Exilibacterium tricleocarpae]
MPDQSSAAGAPKFWVVVPAAGIGTRMGADKPKQYLSLLGQTVLEHTLQRLLSLAGIEGLVVAIHPFDDLWPALPLAQDPRIESVDGGHERCDSVLNGLRQLAPRAHKLDWVLVHDAARPCVRAETIHTLCEALREHLVGGILGVPVSDTLKRLDEHYGIQATLDRRALWYAQTPQMFRYGLLRQALEEAAANKRAVTDEASALEALGYCPRMVEGSRDNIKITRPEDLALAAMILSRQQGEALQPGEENGR